jgi:rare lipoprotein A
MRFRATQWRSWVFFLVFLAQPAGMLGTRPTGGGPLRSVQLGLASYYGPGFHGEETASGRIFNQWAMVAAHPTLPLGTVVRVTNLENGRQVIVQIIDRGPYGRNRRKGTIIDLSKGAAQRLRSVKPGIVPVRVEIVRAASAAARS